MSGVKRVFVEKKKPFAVNAKELHDEITGYLGIKTITDVRVLIRYDIENLSDETYKKALTTVFAEPPVDDVYENEFKASDDDFVFSVEYLPGQFDQRADSAASADAHKYPGYAKARPHQADGHSDMRLPPHFPAPSDSGSGCTSEKYSPDASCGKVTVFFPSYFPAVPRRSRYCLHRLRRFPQ